ncbi:hypothetical protein [Shouchella patagoniensis]|nr:hypothetical protein [Shouchella patagoniensis]
MAEDKKNSSKTGEEEVKRQFDKSLEQGTAEDDKEKESKKNKDDR